MAVVVHRCASGDNARPWQWPPSRTRADVEKSGEVVTCLLGLLAEERIVVADRAHLSTPVIT